jgi:hypothetical protein
MLKINLFYIFIFVSLSKCFYFLYIFLISTMINWKPKELKEEELHLKFLDGNTWGVKGGRKFNFQSRNLATPRYLFPFFTVQSYGLCAPAIFLVWIELHLILTTASVLIFFFLFWVGSKTFFTLKIRCPQSDLLQEKLYFICTNWDINLVWCHNI